jgi:hypothetical protein
MNIDSFTISDWKHELRLTAEHKLDVNLQYDTYVTSILTEWPRLSMIKAELDPFTARFPVTPRGQFAYAA